MLGPGFASRRISGYTRLPVSEDQDEVTRPRSDYAELLEPAVEPEVRCPHSLKVVDARQCSRCLGARPRRRVASS